MGVLVGDRAGFPNGRRLEDDATDLFVQLVGGFLKNSKLSAGDGVDQNDKPFFDTSPRSRGSVVDACPVIGCALAVISGRLAILGGPRPILSGLCVMLGRALATLGVASHRLGGGRCASAGVALVGHLVLDHRAIAGVGDLIACQRGTVARACERVALLAGIQAGLGRLITPAGGARPNTLRDLMRLRVDARLAVAITGRLIAIGGQLIAVGACLVGVRARLISIGQRLVAVSERLLAVTQRLLVLTPRRGDRLLLSLDPPVCRTHGDDRLTSAGHNGPPHG